MRPIRAVVVEDSFTVRRHLVETLSRDSGFEVVGEGADGKQGIELCQRLRPDVVSIDMMMPVMTGVAAVEYIMAYCPTPILVVSASTNRGELFRTYDALAAGAIDVLEKPRGDEQPGSWEERYCSALRLVSRIKVITHPRARLAAIGSPVHSESRLPVYPESRFPVRPESRPPVRPESCLPVRPELVEGRPIAAIGGSTGSPAAIVEILGKLPAHTPGPILLVIHINEPFGAAFAEWLDGQSRLRVRFARDGESLAAARSGTVLMAPPDRHLVIQGGALQLAGGPPRHSCRPSVDVLFESMARELGSDAVGCLLTGMGRDGASGMLAIRSAGGFTIAQDEATSVVFGMPREAILLGGASLVLPVQEIGPALLEAVSPGRRAP